MIHRGCIRFFASAVAVSFAAMLSDVSSPAGADETTGQKQQAVSPVAFEGPSVESDLAYEAIYNQGVTQYREGQYAEARDSFTRSTAVADRALEARARFNLANCDYAEALALRAENPDEADEAIAKLETAISHYRGAIEANPQDADARANAELAQLFIDQIQQEQEQQEQEQQEQEQQEQEQQEQEQQEQDQQDQQEQDEQEQQQEGEQEQNEQEQQQQGEQEQDEQEQQQEGEQDQDQQEQNEQEQNEQEQDQQEGEQDQQQTPGSSGGTQTENSNEKPEGHHGIGSSADGQEPRAMTEEEAEKMLQAVRDRDLKRRYEKLRKTQRYYQPVDRDW
jgi:Ca-activated chloride channel family protein